MTDEKKHNDFKEEKESTALNKVLKFKQSKGYTKKFIKNISGDIIDRTKDGKENERPDFLISSTIDKQKTIIGIEHFAIDHFSLLTKNNDGVVTKVNSQKPIIDKTMSGMIDKYGKEGALDNKQVFVESTQELIKLISDVENNKLNSSYNTLIESFKYSLKKHIKNIEAYCENIKKYAKNGEKCELNFLFDISLDLRNLIFYNGNNYKHKSQSLNIFFEEIVEILEELEQYNALNNIILLISYEINSSNYNVIVLKNKNIRKQILKFTTIYRYLARDRCKDYKCSIEIKKADVQINKEFVTLGIEMDKQKFEGNVSYEMNHLLGCVEEIIECIKNHQPFVTDKTTYCVYQELLKLSNKDFN